MTYAVAWHPKGFSDEERTVLPRFDHRGDTVECSSARSPDSSPVGSSPTPSEGEHGRSVGKRIRSHSVRIDGWTSSFRSHWEISDCAVGDKVARGIHRFGMRLTAGRAPRDRCARLARRTARRLQRGIIILALGVHAWRAFSSGSTAIVAVSRGGTSMWAGWFIVLGRRHSILLDGRDRPLHPNGFHLRRGAGFAGGRNLLRGRARLSSCIRCIFSDGRSGAGCSRWST